MEKGETPQRKAMRAVFEKIVERKNLADLVRENGGNKFEEIKTRLTDVESGKLIADPVIYAIQILNDSNEIRDFYNGYFLDIENNLDKYPIESRKNPKEYAKYDIFLALNLHFYSNDTHKLWKNTLK